MSVHKAYSVNNDKINEYIGSLFIALDTYNKGFYSHTMGFYHIIGLIKMCYYDSK